MIRSTAFVTGEQISLAHKAFDHDAAMRLHEMTRLMLGQFGV
ncbi:hypothetical protein [Saccharopolyspora sp. 5N708]